MALKSAIGKKTTISKPSSGTLKLISPATSAVGIFTSRQTVDENDSIDKVDSAPPAEIVAIADFNRVYESTVSSGKSGKTPYGLYYDALKSIHSISTEDVSYVISKALENDTTGNWEALRSLVTEDVRNVKDLVNDLARFLNSIEKSEKSLDVGRQNDEELTTIARDFLTQRVRNYEKQPEDRSFDLKSILGNDIATDSNEEILRKMLSSLREAITLDSETSYNEFVTGVSQKRENDLNSDNGSTAWTYIDGLPDNVPGRIAACADLISHVLSVSTGIPRVQEDPIADRIGFKPSRLASIFNGSEANAIPGQSLGPSTLAIRKLLSKIGPPSTTIALSLIQFDSSDGKVIIPVETEDSPKRGAFKSGSTALIREAILNGDFAFSDLKSFSDVFEENRGYVDSYMSLMKGFDDPSNGITPVEVLRIIIKNFINGLEYSEKSFDSMLQLLAAKFSVSDTGTQGAASGIRVQPRQHILRAAARIKFYKTKSMDLTSFKTGESGKSQSLTTSRTSEGSESILSNASVSTSLIETTSSSNSKFGKRIIARLASDSPSEADVAESIYSQIVKLSSRSSMSRQDINNRITEKKRDLEALEGKRAAAEREVIAAIGVSAYAALLTGGLTLLVGGSVVVNKAIKKLKFYTEKVNSANEEISDLEKLKNNAVTFLQKSSIIVSLSESQKKTSGNFFSQITQAYDDIVSAAERRLPPEQVITNNDGTTRYGNLDEFGLMSLIVECFAQLASLTKISSEVDSSNNINSTRPSVGAVKSLKNDLLTLIADNEEFEIGSMECDVGDPARLAVVSLAEKQQKVQNILAYLASFSQILGLSSDELISNANDLLADAARRNQIDNTDGRQLISSLTTQQIVYRRALIERFTPQASLGYVPSRIAYLQQEEDALDYLLSSPKFSSRMSENLRIVVAAAPARLIDNEKRYVEKSIGEINRSGMIEAAISRKDQELDDLIFKEKIFLFDPQLFVVPDSFRDFSSKKKVADTDAALSIAKRIKFLLCNRDESSFVSYSDLRLNPRYSNLSLTQIDEIAKNTVTSYLMETYLFKMSGSLFDESISLSLDDSVSQAGIAALSSLSSLSLPDVVLPNAAQINEILGPDSEININSSSSSLTTGDKELIAAITSSSLLRNGTLTERVIAKSSFDRVTLIVIDPDDFEIDRQESVRQNGVAAKTMLESLRKQELIIQDGSKLRVKPRDPLAGGFSIGSIYCQFIPHTVSGELGTLLRISKQSLTSRLTSKSSTGLTSKVPKFGDKLGKNSRSITNSRNSNKISR